MPTATLSAEPTVEPVRIGPAWQRDAEHPSGWLLPKLTLGWAVVAWQEGRFQHANGKQWRYTNEQLRLLLHWYAVDDSWSFVWRDGVLQRLKGWGKDPFGATLCGTEFVGPCRPDPAGRTVLDPWGNEHPAGVAHPEAWVQTAAVSKDQTRNTMTLFPGLFTKAAIEEFSIDLGKEIVYAYKGRCRLEAVTSSPRALEGARATFVLRNETHHWLSSNDGHEMDAVIDRNATKSADGAARALSITNAYQPGEDSVAERARDGYDAVEGGRALATGILYDSLEAPPEAELSAEAAPAVIESIRGDSVWLNVARIVQAILDPRNPPSRSRRFWYNQITATEDAYISPQEWGRCVVDDELDPGDVIALAVDGSLTDDSTAVTACRISDGLVQTLRVWEQPAGPEGERWELDRDEVDDFVEHCWSKYTVVAHFSDYHPLEGLVDGWRDRHGGHLKVKASPHHPIAFDMRYRLKEFTVAAERFAAEVIAGDVRVARSDGNPAQKVLAQHVAHAKRRPNRYGVGFGKEHRESSRKVDATTTAVIARLARQMAIAAGVDGKRKSKRIRRY